MWQHVPPESRNLADKVELDLGDDPAIQENIDLTEASSSNTANWVPKLSRSMPLTLASVPLARV